MKTNKVLIFRYVIPLKNVVCELLKSPVKIISLLLLWGVIVGVLIFIALSLRSIPWGEIKATENEMSSFQSAFTAMTNGISLFIMWIIFLLSSVASPFSVSNGDFLILFRIPLKLNKIVIHQMLRNLLFSVLTVALFLHVVIPFVNIPNIFVLYGTIYNFIILSLILNFFLYFSIIRFNFKVYFHIIFWSLTAIFVSIFILALTKPQVTGFSEGEFLAARFWSWIPVFNLYSKGIESIFLPDSIFNLRIVVLQFITNAILGLLVYLLVRDDYLEELGKAWSKFKNYQENMSSMNTVWQFHRKEISPTKAIWGTGCFTWKDIIEEKRSNLLKYISYKTVIFILMGFFLVFIDKFVYAIVLSGLVSLEMFNLSKRFSEFRKPYIYYFPGTLSEKYWASFTLQIRKYYLNLVFFFLAYTLGSSFSLEMVLVTFIHGTVLFFFFHAVTLLCSSLINKYKLLKVFIFATQLSNIIFVYILLLFAAASYIFLKNTWFGIFAFDVILILLMAVIYPDTEKSLSEIELKE